ncbi:MAG: carbon starvation protein A, partial [Planctomycetales bacterium]|nr:carbon starvation protein A [Planctomycetales bacterium]
LNAPPVWPVLFVTIACGAISGFHCLVSSGTSSKQLQCETDAQFVGYGSMLMEGFLAVLVILAVSAGIGIGWADHPKFGTLVGAELWNNIYHDWASADAGLATKIGAFVVGSANFLEAIGVSHRMALAIMGVLVASFAGTTLDTATRLQRYVVQELSRALQQHAPGGAVFRPLENMHVATLFAVVTAFMLALFPKPGDAWSWATIGKGGMILWPMFGATNQLLGGLAFLVITFWLWRRGKPIWFVAIPTVFMLIMPAWALLIQMRGWYEKESYLLLFIAIVTLALEAWMLVEAFLMFPRAKGVLEEALPPLKARA